MMVEWSENILENAKNTLGDKNISHPEHVGRVLSKETKVKECNLSYFLPEILMVTTPAQQVIENDAMEEIRAHGQSIANKNIKKRTRTESLDSGFGDQELLTNFVTEKEFELVLDIVLKCEILGNHKQKLNRKEMEDIIESTLSENDVDLMNIFIDNISYLSKRKLCKKQLMAFIEDIKELFEDRCVNSKGKISKTVEFTVKHMWECEEHHLDSISLS